MRAILKLIRAAAVVVVFGAGLFLFVLPYEVWGWPGAVAAVAVPGISHLVALVTGGTELDWLLLALAAVGGIIAAAAGASADRV